jgi:hypothetical protein
VIDRSVVVETVFTTRPPRILEVALAIKPPFKYAISCTVRIPEFSVLTKFAVPVKVGFAEKTTDPAVPVSSVRRSASSADVSMDSGLR